MNKSIDLQYIKSEFSKIQKFFLIKDYEKVILKTKVLLKKDRTQITFYNYIGLSYRELNKFELAEETFKAGLKINAYASSLLCNLGALYRIWGKYIDAEIILKRALEINPKDFNALFNFGNLYRDLNKVELAIASYNKAFEINPKNEVLLTSLAATYQIDGNFEKSKEIINLMQTYFPNNVVSDKWYSTMHKYQINDDHQKKMIDKLNNNQQSIENKIVLNFAIAKSYEDQKEYKLSAKHFIEANRLRFNTFKNFEIKKELNSYTKMMQSFENYKFQLNKEKLKPNLVFIVGLPRSGTTLTHQILSSHSEVFGAGELPILRNTFTDLIKDENFIIKILNKDQQNIKYRNDLSLKIINQFKQFEQKLVILDKAPLNFIWIGLIKVLFPNSKIIHCKRNLKDTALSIYKNTFEGSTLPWSYDQRSLIEYINFYKDLMNFWEMKLPDEIFHCEYEKLVNDSENEIKKLVNFCNLNWEEDCLNHAENKTPIKTVSIVQARKPIYKSSVNLSEEYLKYLDFLEKI